MEGAEAGSRGRAEEDSSQSGFSANNGQFLASKHK